LQRECHTGAQSLRAVDIASGHSRTHPTRFARVFESPRAPIPFTRIVAVIEGWPLAPR
jgi:hypothetical protein